MHDLARGALTRLTFQGENDAPVWTPDGRRVTFRSLHEGQNTLSWVPAERQRTSGNAGGAGSLRLARFLVPRRQAALLDGPPGTTVRSVYAARPGGDRKPRPFLQTPSSEFGGDFSPDGRWIAYVSTETQLPEVYVRPAGGGGGKWQVSTDNGTRPRWARNGREPFYRNGDRVMAVTIESGAAFRAGTPKLLLEQRTMDSEYDVSPDARRFLFIQTGLEPEAAAPQVHIVLEWFEDIRRRVRAGSTAPGS